MSNKESTVVSYKVDIPKEFSPEELTERLSFLVWLERAFSVGDIRLKESTREAEKKKVSKTG